MVPAAGRDGLASVGTKELQAELERREKEREEVRAQREQLLEQLKALDGRIVELGGEVPRRRGRPPGRRGRGRGRGRPGRGAAGGSLPDVMQKVLAGKTMSIAEIADAAQAAGYKSASKNFTQVVSQTLVKNSDRFKRVARGQYTVK